MDLSRPNRRRDAGFRLQGDEYSPEYKAVLKKWMNQVGTSSFEDDLIKEGFVSLRMDKACLGLDLILESLSPREDLAFENGAIKYESMRPEKQIVKRLNNEIIREKRFSQQIESLKLTREDYSQISQMVSPSESDSLGIRETESFFRIPEPPYASLLRNAPFDLKISHLRRLREDGYFDSMSREVKIAAYLLSKNFRTQKQIESFGELITWAEFSKAQAVVHGHVGKTLLARSKRIGEVIATGLTSKQAQAFQVKFDIDHRPTLAEAARFIGIDLSSLKERLKAVTDRVKKAFPEFDGLKRTPFARSLETDLILGGFMRKSYTNFIAGFIYSKDHPVKVVVTDSVHDDSSICSADRYSEVQAWLNARRYSPALKTEGASSTRGGYKVQKGRFFHHRREWKEAVAMAEFAVEIEKDEIKIDEAREFIKLRERPLWPPAFRLVGRSAK